MRHVLAGMDAGLPRQSRLHAAIVLLNLLTSGNFQYLTGRETTTDEGKQPDNRISWDPRSNAVK
jgi:hypothetical protein